jgi:hypothetical protein
LEILLPETIFLLFALRPAYGASAIQMTASRTEMDVASWVAEDAAFHDSWQRSHEDLKVVQPFILYNSMFHGLRYICVAVKFL